MTGTTTGNRLRLTRFLPVNLSFVAAFAALKVSFPGACPGKDGSLAYDGKTTEFAPHILFSPREPLFRRRCAPLKVSLWRRMSAVATGILILTGDNAFPLTAFALAFSPVDPLFRGTTGRQRVIAYA